MGKLSRDVIRRAMAQIGAKGGKVAAANMTAKQRVARAKKASLAAAKKRTADRIARDQAKR